jgi:prepilin-type N-terminal cleavage/methylation domain-containing protein
VRLGVTLLEIVVAIAIAGVLFGICLPRLGDLRDRWAVRGASSEVVAALATARHTAIARGRRVAVRFRAEDRTIAVVSALDTLQLRRLGDQYGISLDVSRDSIAYGPTGRGYGAANSRVILSRGAAADTIVVARGGRVRH